MDDTGVVLTLRYLRRQVGLRQQEIASLLGVTRFTIIRWEAGETTPSAVHISELARLFRVPPSLVLDALKISA